MWLFSLDYLKRFQTITIVYDIDITCAYKQYKMVCTCNSPCTHICARVLNREQVSESDREREGGRGRSAHLFFINVLNMIPLCLWNLPSLSPFLGFSLYFMFCFVLFRFVYSFLLLLLLHILYIQYYMKSFKFTLHTHINSLVFPLDEKFKWELH